MTQIIDSRDRLYFMMLREPFDKVRTAFIQRSRVENDRVEDSRIWLTEQGFEQVAVSDGALLADDGREILRAHGRAWALLPEIHATRLAEALEQAKQRDAAMRSQDPVAAASNQSTICTSLIDGQLCGGSLSASPVCPKCALGKQGVAQIMTCDVCGAQTAVMR